MSIDLNYNLLKGIGSEFSIVNNLSLIDFENLPIKLFRAELSPVNHLLVSESQHSAGSNKVSPKNSIYAAIGEFYERYGLSKKIQIGKIQLPADSNSITNLSFEELIEIQGFHPFQFRINNFRFQKIQRSDKLDWIPANRFIDNSELFFPQSAAIMSKHGNPYFEVTSNGCAIQSSKESASLAALYELIERDSLLMFWTRKEKIDFIDFHDSLHDYLPEIALAYGPWLEKIHLGFYRHFTGAVTIIACFIGENNQNQPAFVMSAGTDLNLIKSIEKALLEMSGMLNWKLRYFMNPNRKNIIQINPFFDTSIKTFSDHSFYYMFDCYNKINFIITDLLYLNPKIKINKNILLNIKNIDEEINLLKAGFKVNNSNPIIIEQTPHDLKSLGLYVIRAIDSKMIDLNAAHSNRRWGKSRLLCDRINDIGQLNHSPHPFS